MTGGGTGAGRETGGLVGQGELEEERKVAGSMVVLLAGSAVTPPRAIVGMVAVITVGVVMTRVTTR